MKYFKILTLVLSVFAMATFTSCNDDDEDAKPEVRGCTDPASVNYNASATVSDGSCQYISDAYVGNYIATDTTTHTDPGTGQPVVTISTYSFAIAKKSPNEVEVLNFAQGCTLMATVSATNLTFTNPAGQCAINSAVCFFANGKLKYRYAQGSFVPQQINGTAVKQP